MRRHVLLLLFGGSLLLAPLASAREPVRCITREDPALKRLVTICSDGTRSISRYDADLKRWRTEITKPPGPNDQQDRKSRRGAQGQE